MKTKNAVSMSARIRKFLAKNPNASAAFVAAAVKCQPSLVHQVKSYDKKQAEKRKKSQATVGTGMPATNANGNGVTFQKEPHDAPLDQNKISRILGSDMTTLRRVPTIVSAAESILEDAKPSICDAADIVLSAKSLAARCGGVDGLRQLLDAISVP